MESIELPQTSAQLKAMENNVLPIVNEDDVEESDSESDNNIDSAMRQRHLARRKSVALRRYLSMMLGGVLCCSTFLEQCAVGVASQAEYRKELQSFYQYAAIRDVRSLSETSLDEHLVNYLNTLWYRGSHPSKGEKTLAGLMHHVAAYGRLGSQKIPRAWRALRGWRLLCPSVSREPQPMSVWSLVICFLCESGNTELGVCLLMWLLSYLRPGEGMRVQSEDLFAPSNQVCSFWSLIVCPSNRQDRSKTGESDDTVLFDNIKYRWFDAVLASLRSRTEGKSLWSFSYPQMASEFKRVCHLLGLPHLVPYMTRHSMPSIERAAQERTLAEIMKRGRWRSTKSVNRYEKAGRLQQAFRKVPPKLQALALRCEKHLEEFVLRSGPFRVADHL
jgi:hypothetical protein